MCNERVNPVGSKDSTKRSNAGCYVFSKNNMLSLNRQRNQKIMVMVSDIYQRTHIECDDSYSEPHSKRDISCFGIKAILNTARQMISTPSELLKR